MITKYASHNDNLADAMAKALNDDFSKLANYVQQNSKILEPYAFTIMRSADLLDKIGQTSAADHLSASLEKIADCGCGCPNCPEKDDEEELDPEDVLFVVRNALFDVADNLDKLGYNDISNDIDKSLKVLSGNCDCSGSCSC